MSTLSRGDALAAAVEAYMNPECHMTWRDLDEAIRTYRSTAPTGESVRLAVRRSRDGVYWAEPVSTLPPGSRGLTGAEPICYVAFTIPPRPNPPEIEGVAALDANSPPEGGGAS